MKADDFKTAGCKVGEKENSTINSIPYIFNIQKFSLHDGPGIRTTVFFKGCPLKCQWCHNPESQNFMPEKMMGCREETVGEQYMVRELVKILKKDQIFYDQSGGGVTLSGGEVMAQKMEYVLELVKALSREGISVCVDTSGFVQKEDFARILSYVDLFLYDLKTIDDEMHRQYTGVSNEQILNNLKYLSTQGAGIELRMIMIKNVNMEDKIIEKTAEWLVEEKIALSGITLLPYHDFGKDKYRKLNRFCTQKFEKPEQQELERVEKILGSYGFKVSVQN